MLTDQDSISWGELAQMTHAEQVDLYNWCSCEDNEGQENPFDDCPTNKNFTWERPWNDNDPLSRLFGEGTTALVTDYTGKVVAYCHTSQVLDIVTGLRGEN